MRSSGNSLLELLEPPQPPVEVGVGERRGCRGRSSASGPPRSPRPAAGAPRAPRRGPVGRCRRLMRGPLRCAHGPILPGRTDSASTRRRRPIRVTGPLRTSFVTATETTPRTSPAAPSLTRHDAPDTRGRRADAARRQGALDRARRRPQRVVATVAALMQRGIAPGAHEAGIAIWLLRYRHRGWNGGTRPGRRRPLGAGGGAPGARRGARRAARPLDGWPHRRPRRRRPPGARRRRAGPVASRRASRWPRWPAGHCWRPTVDATGSPRTTRPRRSSSEPPRSPARRRCVDMGAVGHYMLRSVAAWNAGRPRRRPRTCSA